MFIYLIFDDSKFRKGFINMEEKVKEILNQIRPLLQQDGGDVEFVKLENKKVYVRLRGACAGCPGATMTLKMGIERKIKQEVPDIESVEAV